MTAETNMLLITFVIILSIWFYFTNFKRKYSYLKNLGIQGPRPLPLFGNALSLIRNKPWLIKRKWIEKYGRVYGIYSGATPLLSVADVEVVQQITTKDFDSFVNHDFDISNKYREKFLISLKDDHWRRVRALMSPTFTSGKMRRMFELMDNCCIDLVAMFEENRLKSGIINEKDVFNFYTLDTIATCCYGFKLRRRSGSINKTNDAAAAASDEFVQDATKVTNLKIWRILLNITVPDMILKMISFEPYPQELYEPIAKKAARIIKSRRQLADGFQYKDYLQSLLDANLDQKLELEDGIENYENHHAGLSNSIALDDQRKLVEQIKLNQSKNSSSRITMTDEEILCSAIFFLTVGIDTTGNLLTNIFYILAWQPDIQDKLYEEISSLVNLNDNNDLGENMTRQFQYDSLTSAPYLDAVISETLRYMPIITEIDRLANRDCYIRKLGITVPKGLKIALNYGTIMTDPEYWPQPDKFDPDRFSPQNKHKIVPGSYCPFGLGPRHCIGMRFALTETKLAVARLLMNYKIEPAPGTTFPPEFAGHTAMKWIKNPIIKIVTRN